MSDAMVGKVLGWMAVLHTTQLGLAEATTIPPVRSKAILNPMV